MTMDELAHREAIFLERALQRFIGGRLLKAVTHVVREVGLVWSVDEELWTMGVEKRSGEREGAYTHLLNTQFNTPQVSTGASSKRFIIE